MNPNHSRRLSRKRRKVPRGEEQPDPRTNSHLVGIQSARAKVEAACSADGTMFRTVPNDYVYNVLYSPIMAVADGMKSLMRGVERWAMRARELELVDKELSLIAGQTGVTEKSKHEAIVNRLDSMDFLDADYCRSFECVVERIEPVIEALDSFIDFLDAVCTERNSPPVNMPRHSYPPGSATAAVTKDLHNNPSGSSNDDRSSQLDYKPVPFPTISSQSQLQPRVSRWKLSLSHKYCVEDLSVSVAELRVFAKLLVHVRDAHSEALTTVEFCKEMHTLANNMQQIFEDWFYACRRVEERHEKDGKEVDDDDDGYHGKGREKYAEEKDRARRSMSPLLEEI